MSMDVTKLVVVYLHPIRLKLHYLDLRERQIICAACAKLGETGAKGRGRTAGQASGRPWQAVVGGRNEETTVSMPATLGIPQIT